MKNPATCPHMPSMHRIGTGRYRCPTCPATVVFDWGRVLKATVPLAPQEPA